MQFDRTFAAQPGEIVELQTGVRRLTAPNPGPMTFAGTNTYIIGTHTLAIVDPGPDIAAHLGALLGAIDGAVVEAIMVTHTHRDHAPLAKALQAATGAPIVGAGPHIYARSFQDGDAAVDEAVDETYAPTCVLADGETVRFGGATLKAVATPGHTMNHLCFALEGSGILFSGDHVMAWSTSLIAPPDGQMTAYIESLQKLLARDDALYLPGHGARLHDPQSYVQALFDHRMGREAAILAALTQEDLSISALVDRLYDGLDGRLRRAAGLSVLAHLERLESLDRAQRVAGDEPLWRAL